MNEFGKTLCSEFVDKDYAHAYMDQFYDMTISAQIKALREQRGWSQEELAQYSGMKQERISTLESGDYSAWTMSTLRKLAKAFDITVKMSFDTFSKGILDVVNLRREKLQVPSREQDLSRFNECQLVSDFNGEWKTVEATSIEPQNPAMTIMISFRSTDLFDADNWRSMPFQVSRAQSTQAVCSLTLK